MNENIVDLDFVSFLQDVESEYSRQFTLSLVKEHGLEGKKIEKITYDVNNRIAICYFKNGGFIVVPAEKIQMMGANK